MKKILFLLCFLFFSLFPYSDVLPSQRYVPKVALCTFSAIDSHPGHKTLAASLSDLLMIKLGQSKELVLVDRSMIEHILHKRSAIIGGIIDPENALRIGTMVGADNTVTGVLIPSSGKRSILIKIIDTKPGIIRNITRYTIDEGRLETTVEELYLFIYQTLKDPPHKDRNRLFAIGGFDDLGSVAPSIYRGDEIRLFFEERYFKNPAISMIVRSKMATLMLEEDLHKGDRLEGTKEERSIQQLPQASVIIEGTYTQSQQEILLHIDIQAIGEISASLRVEGSSWESLLMKAGEELDDLLQVNLSPVKDVDRIKAEALCDEGLKIIGVDTLPYLGLSFLYYLYKQDISLEQKQQEVKKAVEKFEEAIALYPHYHKAMIALALCDLSREINEEHSANRLFKKVLFGSADDQLKRIAKYRLRDGIVTSRAFSGIVDNTETLFSDLLENGHINEKGIVTKYFQSLESPDEMKLADTFMDRREDIYNVLNDATGSSSLWRKKVKPLSKEEAAHFDRGTKWAHITYTTGFPPQINTKKIGGDGSDQMRRTRIQEAIDSFESVLFLNPENFKAMLFLAFCLKDSVIQETKRADELLERIIERALDDDVRFIAADALDRIEETTFSSLFADRLNASDYLQKKHAKDSEKHITESKKHVEQDTHDRLPDSYKKKVMADRKQVMDRSARNNASSPLSSYLKKKVERFVQITEQAQSNKDMAERRRKILETIWKKYPWLASHLIVACSTHVPGVLDEQLKILAQIEAGNTQPLSSEAFYKELGSRLQECVEEGLHFDAAIAMGEHMRKNHFLDVKGTIYLAYSYSQLARYNETISLVRELVDEQVEIAGKSKEDSNATHHGFAIKIGPSLSISQSAPVTEWIEILEKESKRNR